MKVVISQDFDARKRADLLIVPYWEGPKAASQTEVRSPRNFRSPRFGRFQRETWRNGAFVSRRKTRDASGFTRPWKEKRIGSLNGCAALLAQQRRPPSQKSKRHPSSFSRVPFGSRSVRRDFPDRLRLYGAQRRLS